MNSTILVVDDEEKIRDIYGRFLTQEGYRVLDVPSAIDANELLKKQAIDLILLDINMDDVKGDEFYAVLKSFHREVKVIVASVYSVEDQRLMIQGALDYYDKSQSIESLIEKIKKHLNGRKRNGRVVIIDDDMRTRIVWGHVLTQAGYDTVSFGDRDKILEHLQNHGHEIDLIILDLAMPDVDGLVLYTRIRRYYPRIKVVVASTSPVYDQEFYIRNADGYFEKGMDKESLVHQVSLLL